MHSRDAIVIGGGPAGLSAAGWLGRYRRSTLVVDSERYRNRWVDEVHGVLACDPTGPDELLAKARRDLGQYATVRVSPGTVTRAVRDGQGMFEIELENGDLLRSRAMVLATGVWDAFPEVGGFFEHYGADVFHCPTCEGFEARGRRIAVFGWGEHVTGFALELLDWVAEVCVVTNGPGFEGDDGQRAVLAEHGVKIVEDSAVELLGSRGAMDGIVLASGRRIECTMAFFSIAHRPENAVARQLGCELDGQGYVLVDSRQCTSVPGVFAAGDLTPGLQLVNVAAGQGTVAGVSCALSLASSRRGARNA